MSFTPLLPSGLLLGNPLQPHHPAAAAAAVAGYTGYNSPLSGVTTPGHGYPQHHHSHQHGHSLTTAAPSQSHPQQSLHSSTTQPGGGRPQAHIQSRIGGLNPLNINPNISIPPPHTHSGHHQSTYPPSLPAQSLDPAASAMYSSMNSLSMGMGMNMMTPETLNAPPPPQIYPAGPGQAPRSPVAPSRMPGVGVGFAHAPFATAAFGTANASLQLPGMLSGASRTIYLGNLPTETSAEELLGHVRSGQIESVRMLPDKNCAFISFMDSSSATHFHSDAILKKLAIRGNDVKIGWGKPSQVPTSVALAVQQSGASRNVYLGNLPEEITDEEIREDLGKFGPIDTIKIVKEKNIAFIHYLSISNAIKAVSQLPQEPKYQAPRRVNYGKDRCAYVSKTQQQNAAQYLGIAPGYAHVLNSADRDIISTALAQQSVAAAAVATTAGGVNNLGNRTV
ncbi:hypothetical protein KEM54_000676, partial [Ascosphaera aggregata]